MKKNETVVEIIPLRRRIIYKINHNYSYIMEDSLEKYGTGIITWKKLCLSEKVRSPIFDEKKKKYFLEQLFEI